MIRLRLPALRERARRHCRCWRAFPAARAPSELGVEAKRIIRRGAGAADGTFDFPGNVRQLENICHWLTVMAPAQVIEPKDLPPELLARADAAARPRRAGAPPSAEPRRRAAAPRHAAGAWPPQPRGRSGAAAVRQLAGRPGARSARPACRPACPMSGTR